MTLMDEGEPVLETKKVTDLLAGVQDPRLASAITRTDGDRAKLESFEESQQYLNTIITNSTIWRTIPPMTDGMKVATVETKGSRKAVNRKRKQDGQKGGSESDDEDSSPSGWKVHAGNIHCLHDQAAFSGTRIGTASSPAPIRSPRSAATVSKRLQGTNSDLERKLAAYTREKCSEE